MFTDWYNYIKDENREGIEKFLQENPNGINLYEDMCKITPLMIAVSNYGISSNFIEYLIKKGADVNSKNILGVTTLHYAMSIKHDYKIIKLLLYHGSDVYSKSTTGVSVLDYTKIWRNTEAGMILYTHIKRKKLLNQISMIIVSCKKPNKLVDILCQIPWEIEQYLHSETIHETVNVMAEIKKRVIVRKRFLL